MTHASPPIAGPLPLVDGPAPAPDERAPARKTPPAAVAARLMAAWSQEAGADLIFVAASERRADEIARALEAMAAPEGPVVLVFPPWDCLPYDRAAPSRESMGRRMAVLHHATVPGTAGRLLISSPEAILQRTPPQGVAAVRFSVATGDPLDREALEAFVRRTGYMADERVDEPGEIAILAEVIDVYPPSALTPYRLVLDPDGTVADIRAFDPVTQRSLDSVASLTLTAASELVVAEADDGDRADQDPHALSRFYDAPLGTLFDAFPEAGLLRDDDVEARLTRVWDQIVEAYESRREFTETDGAAAPVPERLYLSPAEVTNALRDAIALYLEGVSSTPGFATARSPGAALKHYIQDQQSQGRSVVLAGLAHEHRVMARLLKRNGLVPPAPAPSWNPLAGNNASGLTTVLADLDGGYEDARSGLTVLTPTDITGGRIARASGAPNPGLGETDIRPGDVVIHEDHGLGVLTAIEEFEADGVVRDVVRLEYHNGATLLAPVEEFNRIWRYSSEPASVSLDRLNTQGWAKRRAEVSAQIDATAARMVELASAREARQTPAVAPPRTAYARFTARFPFPESVDQLSAIDAVLSDLASGRPMNRLVCGDVGFGKTEVALRAAAAVALSGRQVMIAAPTTVLARQHYETFRRRFEGSDVTVAALSRLVDSAEARRVRDGLADGTIGIVVGTQALAQETLNFADLALVVIDEEHRFGATLKTDLAARGDHLLMMSATPIPRTLQSAMVGVQDVSVIASPPARRRPIRTFLTAFDEASVRTVLLREKGRGGQSFVVVPRIEDLEPLSERLARLVPELSVAVAHGKLSAEALEAVMTDFAEGRGDVLLTTNIIENGLDVPRANTLLVWRPDRFGLAQLHQLRGRVGRGRRQGFAYLLSDPEAPLAEATRTRLQTLEALDRLGAGFAISARDLDLRGGGDLVGDEQAGHIHLIGASLYQSVLARALRAARGEAAADPRPPVVNFGTTGRIPPDYVPDAAVRLSLYARLLQMTALEAIDAFQEEIEDRFGPLPEAAETLLSTHRLTALAASAGVTEISCGPKATAFRFGAERAKGLSSTLSSSPDRRWSQERLIVDTAAEAPHAPADLEALLETLAAA